MKKTIEFITHPIVIALIGLTLAALFVWFAGPMFKFGENNAAPLASPVIRLLVIMFIAILWGLNNLRIQLQNNRSNQSLVKDLESNQAAAAAEGGQASEEIGQLGERFGQALEELKKLKFNGKRGKQALYELPWYIIVGPPGAGKTTALVNSGLEFPLAKEFGKGALQGVGGTRNCDWWFTNSAVMIDTAGRYTTQDSHRVVDSSAWEGFLGLLKKHRRRRPINGAIVSISLQDLMTQTEEERALHAKTIRTRIDELMAKLEIRFPIYLMFTKVDMVSGFREFFEDLTKSEREQVWGVTLPDAPMTDQSPDFNFFSDEFGRLMEKLNERVLWGMHKERSIPRRASIYGFPQQMENLRFIAEDFVKQTFKDNRYEYQPYLRGVYFSSATQDGTPIDRLMSSVSANFGFSRESSQSPNQQGKTYFLTRLFSDVIFPESELVGSNAKYEQVRTWSRRGAYIGMAVLSLVLVVTWFGSVAKHRSSMQEVEALAMDFEGHAKRANKRKRDLKAIVPALNALASARQVYDRESHPLLSGLGMYDDRIDDKAEQAYIAQLKGLILPNMLFTLEDEISKGNQSADLYNMFRMYMMFRHLDHMDKALLKAFFEERWSIIYRGQASKRDELNYHLNNLFELDFEPLELNQRLVENTQRTLLQVPVAQRVYASIKSDPAYMQEVNLLLDFGTATRSAFVVDSKVENALRIPYLFTLQGYEDLDISSSTSLVAEVVRDKWMFEGSKYAHKFDYNESDLGDLSSQLREYYYADYIATWRKVLNAIQVVEFKNLSHANDVLAVLVDSIYSPVRSILEVSAHNTEFTPPVDGLEAVEEKGKGKVKKIGRLARMAQEHRPLTKVDKQYAELHVLMREDRQGRRPLNTWLDQLTKVQTYIEEISMAPDPNQRAYEIVLARYQNSTASPIVSLRSQSKKAPDPLNNWLDDVAKQSWRVVMLAAKQHVNTLWRAQVYEPYTYTIAGRYPLNAKSSDELALYDFVEFFKPMGELDKFVSTYVKPFVDTRSSWVNRPVDGYSMGFSKKSLKRLQAGLNIKDVYFQSNSSVPAISLELKPASMHEGDARFILDVADQRIMYNHGPKFWKSLSWEGDDDRKRIRVSMETVEGIDYEQDYYGPWAWFKLMDNSRIKSTSRANVYEVTFEVFRSGGGKSRRIIYEARTQKASLPIDTKLLNSFRAPEYL